uniref:Stimulated by retinoic acid 8 n=1 Tax=Varanus komodoensis TaxID=61221 RepID=A0A8D2L077_VARKO
MYSFTAFMEKSRDCGTPYVRVTARYQARLQNSEPQAGKRRLSQARHRATLAGLFNSLRETVYSQRENSVSKCQVLCKAKNYIQELEQTLENLLKMKGTLCKYLSPFLSHSRYLYFYKQTVDLLIDNGIVSPEEVTLPVVSTAVSHLWQDLPEERRDSVLEYCSQRQDLFSGIKTASQEPGCTEGRVRDSGTNSQEASSSVVSTPEEVRINLTKSSCFTFLTIKNAELLQIQWQQHRLALFHGMSLPQTSPLQGASN